MRHLKIGIMFLSILLTLAFAGCNLFPQEDRARPAPVRPKQTPSPTAPTKDLPGTKALSEKDLLGRITSIEKAVKANKWKKANSAGNQLGLDMARYRPDAPSGKSLRDISRFDAIYTKLQANLKTKNKAGCLKDLKNMRSAMKGLKKK
jgi:hypothetical protein